MPAVLDETADMQPTSNKGKIRNEIELRLREASDRGVRTIVLRAGDFFGRGRGSWFDLVLLKELAKNKVTYPGPLDVVHEWAYLPDYIDALIRLATIRDKLGQYEAFGFSGHAVTGQGQPGPRRGSRVPADDRHRGDGGAHELRQEGRVEVADRSRQRPRVADGQIRRDTLHPAAEVSRQTDDGPDPTRCLGHADLLVLACSDASFTKSSLIVKG